MQIAYLIAAHHQPNHLAKLIRTLDSPGCTFFIHIDAKVDEKMFKEAAGSRSNIVFIQPRGEITWGGFSIVRATLALLSAALEFDRSFQRFCLLSGSDFPIKNNAQILSDFASIKEFMSVNRKLDPSQHDGHHNRYIGFYWFIDSPDESLKNLSGRMPCVKPYEGFALYHGSGWWALTRDCVEYILGFIASDVTYCKFFEHVFCSDEIFFHSILKQSPFASRITHDFETAPDQAEYAASNEHGSHYIDWNAPGVRLPKVLDLQDFDKLLHSKCLFARKFDEQESGELIARLEKMLAG